MSLKLPFPHLNRRKSQFKSANASDNSFNYGFGFYAPVILGFPCHAKQFPYEEVESFLRTHNTPPPALSAGEIDAVQHHLATLPIEEMREQGIFEFLFDPTPEQRKGGGELVAWLDQFISADLLATFHRAAGAGNPYAVYLLREQGQRAARQADRDAPGIEFE